jgi:hypothetical protein
LKAIDADDSDSANDKWKKVYGRPFPAKVNQVKESVIKSSGSWENNEEFIEDKFPVDIRNYLKLDCEVSQSGFREHFLTQMLIKKIPLLANKKLLFTVISCDVAKPYSMYWKVLNRGLEAERKDCIRGKIIADKGFGKRKESTSFRGEHIVDCYIVKDGVVVAKDRIEVPIQ